MKEHIAEEQLALYAAGDLAAEEQRAVAAHVEDCADCRNTATEFRQTRTFLSESLSDPDAADLFVVRESVLRGLAHQRNGGRRWAWMLAGAAAILALAVVSLRFEGQPAIAPLKPPAVLPGKILPLETPHVQTAILRNRHTRARDAAGIRSVALITRANQPPLIKMTTADPKVVILWQSNQTEDEE